jgi:hypothetical protein
MSGVGLGRLSLNSENPEIDPLGNVFRLSYLVSIVGLLYKSRARWRQEERVWSVTITCYEIMSL